MAGVGGLTFAEMVAAAAGYRPYAYQERLAAEGLPDLLRVPTGGGKTLAAAMPWLYRRRFHPDRDVRRATPRWLVVVLPQRALVEQTVDVVAGWLAEIGVGEDVAVHVLMGGVSPDDRVWKMYPSRDAIFVGTQDMVLSRLLLRGYAEPRAAWPVAFGLLHAHAQFVFDEVQLMGPALGTSLQLQGLRELLGTVAPTRSMWMSATVSVESLSTADFLGPDSVVELSEADRRGPLRTRLEATRLIERIDVPGDPKHYARTLADFAVRRHAPGTRTIVIANTVERACQVYDAVIAARR